MKDIEEPSLRTERLKLIDEVFDLISAKKDDLANILGRLNGPKATKHEIDASLDAILTVRAEISRTSPSFINRFGVFHSPNAILYEYVLHCVIPCLYSRHVYIRPASKSLIDTVRLHDFLTKAVALPIEICPVSQTKYCDILSGSEAVIFTGRYENAVELSRHLNVQLFMFAGAGSNPFIVGPGCDKVGIVDKFVNARLLNAGQDCVCPNAMFVSAAESEAWTSQFALSLSELDDHDRFPTAEVSPLLDPDQVRTIMERMLANRDDIFHGGHVDLTSLAMQPIALYQHIGRAMQPEEWFGPVCLLIGYDTIDQVSEMLLRPELRDSAMYLSTFGDVDLSPKVSARYIDIGPVSVLETEGGNEPFGGYGEKASFVEFNGTRVSRPILISQEIAEAFGCAL